MTITLCMHCDAELEEGEECTCRREPSQLVDVAMTAARMGGVNRLTFASAAKALREKEN